MQATSKASAALRVMPHLAETTPIVPAGMYTPSHTQPLLVQSRRICSSTATYKQMHRRLKNIAFRASRNQGHPNGLNEDDQDGLLSGSSEGLNMQFKSNLNPIV
jgi:hypothetical protein